MIRFAICFALLMAGSLLCLANSARAGQDKEPIKALVVGKVGLKLEDKLAKDDPVGVYKINLDSAKTTIKTRRKMHPVQLEAGLRYIITVDSSDKGFDALAILHDPAGKIVAFDDDSGGNLNSRIEYMPETSGPFVLHVGSLGDSPGKYTVKISEMQRNIVRIGFPARRYNPDDLAKGDFSKCDTGWEIDWDITGPYSSLAKGGAQVLGIRGARFFFKDSKGKQRSVSLLRDLVLSELLVAYDKMDPVFLDIAEHAFKLLPAKKEYLGPSCVLPGEILDSSENHLKGKVLKEVHDDGLRWMNTKNEARRGEKMLLWSILDAGNYRYLIEYTFSDDGVITSRIGATAQSYFNKQKDQKDIHLHVGCWRFDPELQEPGESGAGGASQNQALLVRRVPRTSAVNGMFKLDVSPFNPDENGKACEGYADWKPEEFTLLRVQSTSRKNSSKDPQFTSLDLVPMRTGTVRNYPWKYAFANHDFWITLRHGNQTKYHEAPLYSTQCRSLEGKPLRVWHNSAALHVPRAEDYGSDGVTAKDGAALTTWTGFILKPANLYDSTPLFK